MARAARLRAPAAAGAAAATALWALPAAAPHVPPLAAALHIPRRAALDGAVALTFDDGPHPVATPAVLEILAAHRATATFFVIGEQVRRTGGLLGEIRAAGHAVAIHGDRHRGLLRLTPRALADDLDRATATAGEPESGLHRAPYGVYSSASLRAVRRRGWTPLLWSRWGRDWRARATPRSVADEVTRDAAAGDVLLLHDADQYGAPGAWRATVAALPVVLERLAAAGLAARAVTAAQVRGAGR
jgi:peptidoglycan-N-acetylglucosamine deacetylase